MLRPFFLFLTLMVLTATTTHAQFRKRSERRSALGIFKVGMNVSFLNPDISYSNSARVGVTAGLAPAIPLNKRLYLKPELSFSMKGGQASYNQSFFNGTVRYRLNYFEFPLTLGVNVSKRIALEAGAYGALRLSSNFDFSGNFFYGYGTFAADDLNSFDYGVVGGIVFKGRRVALGIRYYYGLNEVSSNPSLEGFLGNATNHTFQLYLQGSTRR